ncbi:hypothetical protein GCM10009780_63420 [Actinomadura alba]
MGLFSLPEESARRNTGLKLIRFHPRQGAQHPDAPVSAPGAVGRDHSGEATEIGVLNTLSQARFAGGPADR